MNINEMHKLVQNKLHQDIENKNLQTQYLKEINDSVGNLTGIMEVMKVNSEYQTQMLELINDILLLSQAANEQEAESIYKKVTGSLGELKNNIELYQFFSVLLQSGWQYFKLNNGLEI